MSDLQIPLWVWGGFIAFVVLLLALDLGFFARRGGEIGIRRSLILSAFYIALALIFGVGVLWLGGSQPALEFFAGFVIEKSLSLDNIFVFVVIFRSFGIPSNAQHGVLFWGILGALVMRGLFIAVGVGLIRQFEWIMFVFGAFLILSGGRILVRGGGVAGDPTERPVYRFLTRRMNVTSKLHGRKFFLRQNGTLCATPLFVALVVIEGTDVMFALDSIPAIFSVTQDPFIIFTSNVFAVLGLRALYFALRDVIERFRYLEPALSLLLVVIGVKMIVGEFISLPVWLTLGATLTVLGGGIALSLIRSDGAGTADERPPE